MFYSLTNFPSWNDFAGPGTTVRHGSYALVLRSIGVPWKLSFIENAHLYEIYEVLTSKLTKRCVLAFNLKKVF